MRYPGFPMGIVTASPRLGVAPLLLAALLALALAPATAARAAVVAEGTYTITAPERRQIPFRMVLTPTGARITPAVGETLVFSYETRSALVIDGPGRSYFPLPLDLVPALLSAGLGYDSRGLGAAASGKKKKLLGTSCEEVTVSGRAPRFTMRACRVADPAWSREYARLEGEIGLPWATADPPAVFVGLPLSGSIDIEGPRPYRASWLLSGISRDARAGEDFRVPAGYRVDLERLLTVQQR